MTERKSTQPQYGIAPSQIAEMSLSVLRRMYRDAERRKGVAQRIRQLWEDSAHTEPEIADAIGVSLSGYQKEKRTGMISREHLEKLAEFHGTTPEWILTGRERGETPDALETFSDNGSAGQIVSELKAALLPLEQRLTAIENQLSELATRPPPDFERALRDALPILVDRARDSSQPRQGARPKSSSS